MNSNATTPWLVETSSLGRMGLKGSGAAGWLLRANVNVPAEANSWAALDTVAGSSSWSLVARLGSIEFLLEEDAGSHRIRELARTLADGDDHVYPVLREDRAFVLGGQGAEGVLAQMCNVNFAAIPLYSHTVVLTLMTGVAVVVVPQRLGEGRRYRIWCDPTFGHYLWDTLRTIVVDSGGEALALEQLQDGPRQ